MSIKPIRKPVELDLFSSISISEKRYSPGSTEEAIESYKSSILDKPKCKACGEPVEHFGYCDDCYNVINQRIDFLQKRLELEPARLYKEVYVVKDITNLD